MDDVLALLQNHRSVRQFMPTPVSDEQIAEIIRCGQQAATSSHLQACTVISVRDPEQREALAQWAGNQDQIRHAGAFLVFCADWHRAAEICARRKEPFITGMTEHFLIATIDTALFAQNCVIAAESLGLGTCYIGALRNHPREVSDLLHLPSQSYPVFGLCLGEPAQVPERKPRLPLSVVLKTDHYDDTQDAAALAAYDAEIQTYYASRSSGQKDSSWTAQIAAHASKEARPHLRGFLDQQGLNQR